MNNIEISWVDIQLDNLFEISWVDIQLDNRY